MFFLFLFASSQIYSMGSTEIKINFKHSRRIPFNTINMEINQNRLFVKVAPMEGHTGFEYSNFEREIEITQEYYEEIYRKFLNINYGIIIDKSTDIIGADGTIINIIIGTSQNKMEITLWSIDYMTDVRNTTELVNLIKEIFSLVDLENYIF